MTAGKIPHNALIVVADGTGARFFRNSGQENKVSLSADSEFIRQFTYEGPAGKRRANPQARRPTRPRLRNSWQISSIAVSTAETLRRSCSSPIHRPWAESGRHCTRRFRIHR